jgi:arylformamidase
MAQGDEKRVVFDFEIEFSNGGGMQGQDFRLDLHGDQISDQQLADYLVRDMRLLMVKSVRILDKRIISEPHKRPLRTAAAGCELSPR